MEKDQHPFLQKYALKKPVKYIVIGTIPPSIEAKLTSGKRKFKIKYFYGNVASFWNILKEVYTKNSFDTIKSIQEWQQQYSVGFTDTVIQCKRKGNSFRDSDLKVDYNDLNHKLKDYILKNNRFIEKLIFTSGENCNNALFNFKIIMGEDYIKISKKVVKDLPSPSGSSNTSYFCSNEDTLGLKKEFYDYLISLDNDEYISYVRKQWKIKQTSKKGEKVQRIPKNLLKNFKTKKYRDIFPPEN
ncbi:hypothetical protein [Corallibacter sp.]|uniref:hypothetical protein n=1 Tax=Corallibacter sp. TaxID=2038084 RepID=UPI003AB21C37